MRKNTISTSRAYLRNGQSPKPKGQERYESPRLEVGPRGSLQLEVGHGHGMIGPAIQMFGLACQRPVTVRAAGCGVPRLRLSGRVRALCLDAWEQCSGSGHFDRLMTPRCPGRASCAGPIGSWCCKLRGQMMPRLVEWDPLMYSSIRLSHECQRIYFLVGQLSFVGTT
jgi:hypothetical protein